MRERVVVVVRVVESVAMQIYDSIECFSDI